ncbi:hypothetical protein LINGRAPRIM_LOCUS1439 [Linum grandiflorum]
MDATEFIAMYDFCWFEMEIFRPTRWSASLNHQQQPPAAPPPPPPEGSNPRHNQSTTASSTSGYSYSKPNFNSGVFLDSPDSVLTPPQLTTILSGKEFSTEKLEESNDSTPTPLPPQRQQRKVERRIRGSKSLTDLECEELKGFMDLGFVFSEKDKDSRLVSILPGLQKLGKTEEEEEKGRKKIVKKKPLMNLRVSIGSDVELKDSLRMWAHSVASTVR